MTVYVDNMRRRWNPPHCHHRVWIMSHLFADTDEELHEFAERLGSRREWHQCPPKATWSHYDVTDTRRRLALKLGAVPVQWRSVPGMLREMGRR